MTITWVALAILAIALAWPVPILLARASWPARAPATALIVWQAIALAGGLSMLGALFSFGLEPFGDDLATGLAAFPGWLVAGELPAGTSFLQMFAVSGGILLGVHLLLTLGLTFARAERSRRRHGQLVRLLSAPIPERPGMRLLEHEAPVAYCLPGTTRSVTVLSAGLVELLDDQQLQAVIAHELAHATQRHHLLLVAFRAWRGSLPWFPIATRALDAVTVLVEMLADDRARQQVPDEALAASIALVASASDAPAVSRLDPATDATARALAADGHSAERRLTRLITPGRPLGAAGRALALICSVALLAVPTVLIVAPAVLA
ncbi:M56 family metallopeptidase [Lacisediminihabitans changchengi]|uniref:M56 family metallopeptidase n=1 Tax=Lacisediminihabitans changchengi TaxID=2787634 RepID=A0A934SN38_9MICO|nr:M56 family metallopeptidase [Lacisediminihabitans changchengi]MBK4346835.1 M56 family metallopeptidase [Lacisediminihabitans changchengi]MBK4348042.1 M56 family metallopeptidase [Lacisediminihabitans changchengi]